MQVQKLNSQAQPNNNNKMRLQQGAQGEKHKKLATELAGWVQDTREVATSLQRAAPQLHLLDRKRKLEQVFRMQQRWQRWEISNFEYLMRVRRLPVSTTAI